MLHKSVTHFFDFLFDRTSVSSSTTSIQLLPPSSVEDSLPIDMSAPSVASFILAFVVVIGIRLQIFVYIRLMPPQKPTDSLEVADGCCCPDSVCIDVRNRVRVIVVRHNVVNWQAGSWLIAIKCKADTRGLNGGWWRSSIRHGWMWPNNTRKHHSRLIILTTFFLLLLSSVCKKLIIIRIIINNVNTH